MRKRLFQDKNPTIASSLNNLAEVYKVQGRYSEAENLILEAIEIRTKLLGEEHVKMANSFKSLAEVYKIQDCYSEAQLFFVKGLVLREQALGAKHPKTLEIKTSLVNFLLQAIAENKADLETLRNNPSSLIQSILVEVQANIKQLE